MFCINMAEGKDVHKVCLRRQREKGKAKREVEVHFTIVNGKITSSKRITSDTTWHGVNVESLTRGLLHFFLASKFTATTNWTTFWHIKKSEKNETVYAMYDCGLPFILANGKYHEFRK